MTDYPAFRLGDIRGVYPEDIDEQFVTDFAHAFVGHFGLNGQIATGRDMRASSASLQHALNDALRQIGIAVVDIGLCPTELGYFASAMPEIQAAIVVTASHNPARYNGLKCVLKNGQAITLENGLQDVRLLMMGRYRHRRARGSLVRVDYHSLFLDFLSRLFPPETLRGGTIALNGLNGTAATMAGRIATAFDLPVTWYRKAPGPIPVEGADPANPVLVEEMSGYMAGKDFVLGVSWDGDCDRCVCFDSDGRLIPTYYLVGLLAEKHLVEQPGASIVFDTKLCWNTLDVITAHGGKAVPAKTGHAFMKQQMHAHHAAYGGELSSHHYFGEFFGCDSGMFAWLTVLKLVNERRQSLRELVAERREAICCTPEINLALKDVSAVFAQTLSRYEQQALSIDHFDGLGFSMPGEWRFSLRRSKTESLVRVNFESRGDADVMLEGGRKLLESLSPYRTDDVDWQGQLLVQ